MSFVDHDRWTRLFRWYALVGAGLAACAVAAAVLDPREGALPPLPPGAGSNPSELLAGSVYGSAALALVAVLAWRLRRSLSWNGDRAAAAVQIALLLPAVVGTFYAFWALLHELFAFAYPLNDGLLAAIQVQGTIFALIAGVALSLVLLGSFGLARLLVRDERRRDRIRRWSRIARSAVLLLPFGWFAVVIVAHSSPLGVLACVGTTGLAFLGLHLVQGHRRMPVWVLAGAFGWGTWVASGFAGLVNVGYLLLAPPVLRHVELANVVFNTTPAIYEEAAKAAGIALLCLLAGRRFRGVVSGLAVGAAVGLGFNFVESVEYMSQGAAFQYWVRQVVGIGGAHLAFSAIVGAGIGLAYRGQARRRVAVYGYVTALCGHFLSNYGMGRVPEWFGAAAENPFVWVLVVMPGALVVLQGPFVVMYVLVLRRGHRADADDLSVGARRLPGSAARRHRRLAGDGRATAGAGEAGAEGPQPPAARGEPARRDWAGDAPSGHADAFGRRPGWSGR